MVIVTVPALAGVKLVSQWIALPAAKLLSGKVTTTLSTLHDVTASAGAPVTAQPTFSAAVVVLLFTQLVATVTGVPTVVAIDADGIASMSASTTGLLTEHEPGAAAHAPADVPTVLLMLARVNAAPTVTVKFTLGLALAAAFTVCVQLLPVQLQPSAVPL